MTVMMMMMMITTGDYGDYCADDFGDSNDHCKIENDLMVLLLCQ
jgi:hypothetical protein